MEASTPRVQVARYRAAWLRHMASRMRGRLGAGVVILIEREQLRLDRVLEEEQESGSSSTKQDQHLERELLRESAVTTGLLRPLRDTQ